MTMPRVLSEYLTMLAIPWLAGPSHRVFIVTTLMSPDFYLPFVALLALGGLFHVSLRNNPRRPLYVFCAAWIAIALAPVMDLFALPKDQMVHDGYLYLASAGWCVMVASAAIELTRLGALAVRLVWAAAAAVAVVCAATLWNAQRFWHDDMALFTRCVETFPESWQCHYNLGVMLRERGDLPGAERELRAALTVRPDSGDTRYTLGLVHARLGRTREGVEEMASGLAHTPHPPAKAFIALAEWYEAGGDSAGAEHAIKDALRVDPENDRALMLLGILLAQENRHDEALALYRHALRLAPGDARPHFFSARSLHAMGQDREAQEQCRQALAIAPDDKNVQALAAEIERALHPSAVR
jgi:tetratricopeptide (TPR) repeat protein